MKLSDNQAHQLIVILQSSIEKNLTSELCYDRETRINLFKDIMNQQDSTVIELSDKKEPTPCQS
ncbi:MAG: hypothetical protein GY845_03195 [Planctomycetes bacterium]|nr:hypothetical protein [Planctomycetota bacterium]